MSIYIWKLYRFQIKIPKTWSNFSYLDAKFLAVEICYFTSAVTILKFGNLLLDSSYNVWQHAPCYIIPLNCDITITYLKVWPLHDNVKILQVFNYIKWHTESSGCQKPTRRFFSPKNQMTRITSTNGGWRSLWPPKHWPPQLGEISTLHYRNTF
jgi:hypothetical protein